MFNLLKGHKNKSPVQKHILKGFLNLSQCLLNVISAIRLHQHWHWKGSSARFPPPGAVQSHSVFPVVVSRHWLMPDHSFSFTYTPPLSALALADNPVQKAQRFLIPCNKEININTERLKVSISWLCPLHPLHALFSIYQRPVAQDSGMGGM